MAGLTWCLLVLLGVTHSNSATSDCQQADPILVWTMLGGNASLECRLPRSHNTRHGSSRVAYIRWRKGEGKHTIYYYADNVRNTRPKPANVSATHTETSSSIHISGVTLTHGGIYSCELTTRSDFVCRQAFKLVVDLCEEETQTVTVTAPPGEAVSLPCRLSASELHRLRGEHLNVRWNVFLDNNTHLLVRGDSYNGVGGMSIRGNLTQGTSSLDFYDLSASHRGLYVCSVSSLLSPGRECNRSFRLRVQGAGDCGELNPSRPPESVTCSLPPTALHQSLTWKIQLGNSTTELKVTRNGSRLIVTLPPLGFGVKAEHREGDAQSEEEPETILSAAAPSLGGRYACRLARESNRCFCEFEPLTRQTQRQEAPRDRPHAPASLEAEEGDRVTFRCQLPTGGPWVERGEGAVVWRVALDNGTSLMICPHNASNIGAAFSLDSGSSPTTDSSHGHAHSSGSTHSPASSPSPSSGSTSPSSSSSPSSSGSTHSPASSSASIKFPRALAGHNGLYVCCVSPSRSPGQSPARSVNRSPGQSLSQSPAQSLKQSPSQSPSQSPGWELEDLCACSFRLHVQDKTDETTSSTSTTTSTTSSTTSTTSTTTFSTSSSSSNVSSSYQKEQNVEGEGASVSTFVWVLCCLLGAVGVITCLLILLLNRYRNVGHPATRPKADTTTSTTSTAISTITTTTKDTDPPCSLNKL